MEANILGQPSYSTLHLKMNAGESIKVEPGAMVGMEPTIEIKGKMEGGLFGGLKRTFLTGESFFMSTMEATQNDSDVFLAPRAVGDIHMLEVSENRNWIIQGGGFLASTSDIETDSKFEGLRGFFSGEGFFMMKVSGNGNIWVSSFGAIVEYELKDGKPFIVDNAHIVAFENSLQYDIKKAGNGFISSITTGEGWVCEFKGTGKLYLQTRNLGSFTETLNPFMAKRQSSGLFGRVFGG